MAYEGFLGDPIGGGIRYYFTYDDLTLNFRGGTGIGGTFSYLNLHLMGDVAITVPVAEEVSVYMGGGVLTGVRVIGGGDVGLGVKVLLGAEMRATDKLSLGFEFAPLVVRSFGGRSHPALSFGLRAIYFPEPPEREVVVKREVPEKAEVSPNPPVERERREGVETRKGENGTRTSSERRAVDREAAEREYKLGLQAYANGDLREAKLHFEAALRYDPNHERARMALEKVKRQLGER